MKVDLSTLAVLCAILLSADRSADSIRLNRKPLRTLNVGSTIELLPEATIREHTIYQDGAPVLIGLPPFDAQRPYCEVKLVRGIDRIGNSPRDLPLRSIEGAIIDNGNGASWAPFITILHFSNRSFALSMECHSPSRGQLRETRLFEFESIFSGHIRFASLSLGDSGREIRDPTYGEYDVLTPQLLQRSILLRVLEDVRLRADGDDGYVAHLRNGGSVQEFDPDDPFCTLWSRGWNNRSPEVRSGEILRFRSVSGSYEKNEILDSGFILNADLSGSSGPLGIYCSSKNPNSPLRYAGAAAITRSILPWRYTNIRP
jgi:hypothetical protein